MWGRIGIGEQGLAVVEGGGRGGGGEAGEACKRGEPEGGAGFYSQPLGFSSGLGSAALASSSLLLPPSYTRIAWVEGAVHTLTRSSPVQRRIGLDFSGNERDK
jgi:hypothetical protein